VKSTSYLHSGSYRVLALRHWRGQTVTYQPSEVDFLVAHVIPEEAWFVLPIRAIGDRPILTLGPSASVPPRPRLWDAYPQAWHLFRHAPPPDQPLPPLPRRRPPPPPSNGAIPPPYPPRPLPLL